MPELRRRLASNPGEGRGTICTMRVGWFVVGVLVGVTFASCGPREARARGQNEAIFELGGATTPPLSEVLRAAAEVNRRDPSRELQVPLNIPVPPRPVRYRTLTLGAGETLSAFCARHLGDSSRWREVAELNGWAESDLRRLATGTEVRIPVDR